jgi:choline dehydrogenase-like flavoprotein
MAVQDQPISAHISISAATSFFTQAELRLLTAICDTLMPAIAEPNDPHGYFALAASDLGVPQAVADILAALPSKADRAETKLLFKLLTSPALGLLLAGQPRAFLALNLAGRERFLRGMAVSRMPQLRSGFQVLKRLTLVNFHGLTDEHRRNPTWPAIGYSGPISPPPALAKPITPLAIQHDTTLDCDVVVIGSGAGGGVVAGELTAAGTSVIVLEQGGYYNEADYNQLELDMLSRLYLDGGATSTKDRSLTILAGGCLGGGTVVNYTTSFRTPDRVREEWARDFGLPGFLSAEYTRSMDAVSARINVNQQHNRPSCREELMARGLTRLGYHLDAMPRNVADCTQDAMCGFCGLGCQHGHKQSTLKTYLQDAYDQGARIVVGASADRVLIAQGRAVGVVATVRGADGQTRRLTVRAKAVVAACGAIHTPALLLRSGLRNPHIGRHLGLHPVSGIWGIFDEQVQPWTGAMQALYSDQMVDMDGRGYGAKFETAPVHPSLPMLGFPWESGRQFKRLMTSFPHLSVLGVLLRDRDGGRITIDRQGLPVIDYRISAYDSGHMRRGLHEAAQVLLAAGARELFTGHARWVNHKPGGSDTVDDFMRRIDAAGYGPNRMAILTFHQMATCRMGSDPRTAVIDGQNQSHEVRNLFVADASAFPTSSGVNPMLTIMAIAHRAAQAVKNFL